MVETLGVKAWYVEENDSRPLPDTFSGQFHTADTYVVRWKYKVSGSQCCAATPLDGSGSGFPYFGGGVSGSGYCFKSI